MHQNVRDCRSRTARCARTRILHSTREAPKGFPIFASYDSATTVNGLTIGSTDRSRSGQRQHIQILLVSNRSNHLLYCGGHEKCARHQFGENHQIDAATKTWFRDALFVITRKCLCARSDNVKKVRSPHARLLNSFICVLTIGCKLCACLGLMSVGRAHCLARSDGYIRE